MVLIGVILWLAAAVSGFIGLFLDHGQTIAFGLAIGLFIAGAIVLLLRVGGIGESLDSLTDAVVDGFSSGNDNGHHGGHHHGHHDTGGHHGGHDFGGHHGGGFDGS